VRAAFVMNCPSRVDPEVPLDWNQSPNELSADVTTRSDLNKIANARLRRDHKLKGPDALQPEPDAVQQPDGSEDMDMDRNKAGGARCVGVEGGEEKGEAMLTETMQYDPIGSNNPHGGQDDKAPLWRRAFRRTGRVLLKYSKFIGPGFMISVAYIDPGNYATDVAAGASYRFKLLFMVLLSNLFAIFLQSLCIKLGSVTGLNLAEMCRAHLPRWLNYTLYAFAEAAIIATDIAEVIGTAIALELLLHIPLVAGCAISIVDVMFILIFYRPEAGSMKALRAFEYFVVLLVLGVVICFCFQLSLIKGTATAGEVFRGFLPSKALVQGQGLYQACGILGATVMPHSLYLGSGIVQPRLKDFDAHHPQNASAIARSGMNRREDEEDDETSFTTEKYRPSIAAIKSCMAYSIAELSISLFTFALFVNSAILIVAGASLSTVAGAANANLFGIHTLLSKSLAPAAGTIFALALLLSGVSAGIICTIAGQMVSEGQLSFVVKPWVRRLITRSISITPSIIIAGAVGKEGLSAALEGTQVALSVILPLVSAPLIYFTCRNKYMTVGGAMNENDVQAGECGAVRSTAGVGTVDSVSHQEIEVQNLPAPAIGGLRVETEGVKMRNHWITTAIAILVWGIIVIMNVALLVLMGLGTH